MGLGYDLAVAHKLMRLYEHGRELTPGMMREIDNLHVHYETEKPSDLLGLIRETNKLDEQEWRMKQACRLHALYRAGRLGFELTRAMDGR
jgi:hypothetical protein